MTDTWILLPRTRGGPAEELPRSEQLLDGLLTAPRPALRFYDAPDYALVLGPGQKGEDLDRVACAQLPLGVHRRGSGGTAVLWHPGFLMLDVALPAGHPLHHSDITLSYQWLGEAWARTLQRLGIDAQPIPIDEARADTRALEPALKRICFAGRSPFEVLVAGRKLVGLSQKRRRQGTLLQAGLYWRWEGARLAEVMVQDPDQRAALVGQLGARVCGLDQVATPVPDDETVAARFLAVLAERHSIRFEQPSAEPPSP